MSNQMYAGEREDRAYRVLMYSHDTYGLGHLRRSRAIANALVERFDSVTVLIISGSVMAGAFEFHDRVDFIKVPNVTKLVDGTYGSSDQGLTLREMIEIRKSLILDTVQNFRPDMLIVDKEPAGLHSELIPSLNYLSTTDCVKVLGLREVLDAPETLIEEWHRKNAFSALETYYDDIWVYGPEDFYEPLAGMPLSDCVFSRIKYLGFLKRDEDELAHSGDTPFLPDNAILVTAGGGGDGEDLMRATLNAIEHQPSSLSSDQNYIFLLGPFMPNDVREALHRQADPHPNIWMRQFDNHVEDIYRHVSGVIAMGGYNTFCEIISFNKRALIMPRTHPRKEQWLRTRRAVELGLVSMIEPTEAGNPALMSQAISRAMACLLPSEARDFPDFDGLDRMCDVVESHMNRRHLAHVKSA